MGRIATTQDVGGIRDQEDVGDVVQTKNKEDFNAIETEGPGEPQAKSTLEKINGKYVANLQEVHDAFDSVNTLRYSQPTHLQGRLKSCILISITSL